MDSKLFAWIDSSLWFVKVGVAAMLMMSTIAEEAGNPTVQTNATLNRTQITKVELVRKLQDRRDRRDHSLHVITETKHG